LSGAPEMDKHSSLFDTFISYTEKKFYNIGPNLTKEEEFSGQSYKYFFTRNFQLDSWLSKLVSFKHQ